MEIQSLQKTKEIFEGWVASCTQLEQLHILMDIVEEFISFGRYPDAEFDEVNNAQINLYIAIDLKAIALNPRRNENKEYHSEEKLLA